MAKILVADDEEDVGVLISARLHTEGHEVEWVNDGMQAIARVEESCFDLVILDIRMPGCGGYAVCSVIKNSEKSGKTPVLLMSAYEKDPKNWQKARADAFLSKPFETKELITIVEKLLRSQPKN